MPERGSESARYEDAWAAIEQAQNLMISAFAHAMDGQKAKAQRLGESAKLDFEAAVGEAKRRESELERERDDLQRKIDGYFLSSEFAWWVEKAEKAEARAAEHLKAHDEIDLRWRRAEARVAELERALEYAERWIEHPNYRRIGRARREATGE